MSASPDIDALLAIRARIQRLTPNTRLDDPRDADAVFDTIRTLAPLAPRAFTFPGTPPQLAPRVTFDDLPITEELRRRGAIVKGRFRKGNIGYIATDDLPLYKAAYGRDPERISPEARTVVDLLSSEGPLPRSDIMALMEIPGRRMSAALTELQRCFVVTELQYETEWDNAWALMHDEYPDLEAIPQDNATDEVVARLLDSLAFATIEQIRDGSGLPLRRLRASLDRLVSDGRALAHEIDGDRAWLSASVVGAFDPSEPEPYVAVVTPSDPLVIAYLTELKARFGRAGILAYIVIDSHFAGAALGRWGIAPFDVQDIFLEPPYDTANSRRAAIIDGIRTLYPPPRHRILRFLEEPLDA